MTRTDSQSTDTALCSNAVVTALVRALDDSGVLPVEAYRDTLERIWIDMPEEQALGEAGAMIEQMLDQLAGCETAKTGAVSAAERRAFLRAV